MRSGWRIAVMKLGDKKFTSDRFQILEQVSGRLVEMEVIGPCGTKTLMSYSGGTPNPARRCQGSSVFQWIMMRRQYHLKIRGLCFQVTIIQCFGRIGITYPR